MKTSSSLCTCTKGNVNLPPYHMIFLNILLLTQCSKRLSRYLTTKKKKIQMNGTVEAFIYEANLLNGKSEGIYFAIRCVGETCSETV